MRILICGTRAKEPVVLLTEIINLFPKDTIVIHGAARGVDSTAGQVASAAGLEVVEFPADWKTYGVRAGPIRNQQMLTEGKPDIVIAIHDDPALGKGTADMVRRARLAKVPVYVFGC